MVSMPEVIKNYAPLCAYAAGAVAIGYLGYRAVQWIINGVGLSKRTNQLATDALNNRNKIFTPQSPAIKQSLIAKYAQEILPFYQNALANDRDPKVVALLKQYRDMAPWYNPSCPGSEKVFLEADFLVIHGAVHVSHVALLVPIMVNFYRAMEDPRIKEITPQEIAALQVAAFYHDFGRTIEKNDVANDYAEAEIRGANACTKFLLGKGFSTEIAKKMADAITYKDKNENNKPYEGKDFTNKCIFREILQNCDCIAYIRAHDASFSDRYLDVVKRLEGKEGRVKEDFYEILDSTKLFLMSIGDSPDKDYKPLSKKYQVKGHDFTGRANLEDKRAFEKDPTCFKKMKKRMFMFEDLKRWYKEPANKG